MKIKILIIVFKKISPYNLSKGGLEMFYKIALLLLSLTLLTACSSNDPITYTNLSSTSSQDELTLTLSDAGLPKKNIEQFLAAVTTYNQNNPNLSDSEQVMEDYFVSYTPSVTIPNDLDSQVASFILAKDLISTNYSGTLADSYLTSDLALLTADEQLKFATTFNTISVTGIKNNEISHINQIEKTFNDRNFTVDEDQDVSLITLWVHISKENIRYVNHSGVLVDHDKLYFIEKYARDCPYQMTKFNSRKELSEYLLNRSDLKGDENDGPPLVFENNKYLKK